jgi:hypothetical protein
VEAAKHSSVLALLSKSWEERARKLFGALLEREEEGGEPSTGRLAPSRQQQGSTQVGIGVTAHSGGGKQRQVAVRLTVRLHWICIVQRLSKAPNFEIHKRALHDLLNS